MSGEGAENWTELLISLETLRVVGREPLEDYDDNYVRRYTGPVRIQREKDCEPKQIGEIEVWYIDGSRAADNGLDIVDVCDSMTQAAYGHASAIYTDGSIDTAIVEEPFYNDVLVVHALDLTTGFQGQGLEARIIRKIGDTLGYHCAAIVFDPDRVGIAEDDGLVNCSLLSRHSGKEFRFAARPGSLRSAPSTFSTTTTTIREASRIRIGT